MKNIPALAENGNIENFKNLISKTKYLIFINDFIIL